MNSVNPENQTTTGYVQNFVVTANCSSDSSGNVAIPIYPSIVVAGAGVADGTVTASPAPNAPVTLMSGLGEHVVPDERGLSPGRIHAGDGGPGDAEGRRFRGA